ncbi:YuiB family protein [Pseudalkalibacillus berkeleyi]|uniref:YuiB family protein n=1 Tax=Pseudalkalibacillus berkeleyi TaxID=1069813 RepID=A0ABS9H0J5_9BACL|nr:YuiB family protein [Pseudalkalibacillus berkeleyi]MCF6138523.1 YuiB family protein [Pseudalkalibacillus berkeleyi]
MPLTIPTLIISMLLFMVLFFGIGFLLNMLLRMTWVMAVIYPVVVVMIIDKVDFLDYFTAPGATFQDLLNNMIRLHFSDILVLIFGLLGAILSGITIKMLRVRGYQMF